jgi:hypothetical protein
VEIVRDVEREGEREVSIEQFNVETGFPDTNKYSWTEFGRSLGFGTRHAASHPTRTLDRDRRGKLLRWRLHVIHCMYKHFFVWTLETFAFRGACKGLCHIQLALSDSSPSSCLSRLAAARRSKPHVWMGRKVSDLRHSPKRIGSRHDPPSRVQPRDIWVIFSGLLVVGPAK